MASAALIRKNFAEKFGRSQAGKREKPLPKDEKRRAKSNQTVEKTKATGVAAAFLSRAYRNLTKATTKLP